MWIKQYFICPNRDLFEENSLTSWFSRYTETLKRWVAFTNSVFSSFKPFFHLFHWVYPNWEKFVADYSANMSNLLLQVKYQNDEILSLLKTPSSIALLKKLPGDIPMSFPIKSIHGIFTLEEYLQNNDKAAELVRNCKCIFVVLSKVF